MRERKHKLKRRTERKKLRIIHSFNRKTNEFDKIRTLTTYRKFKKRFPDSQFGTFTEKKKLRNGRTIKVKTRSYTDLKFSKQALERQEKERQQRLSEPRIRKQIALYYKVKENAEDYGPSGFIQLKAVTINPDINEKGLLLALNDIEKRLRIDKSLFNHEYRGMETTRIPTSEDKVLNDERIHIEVLENGRLTGTFIR